MLNVPVGPDGEGSLPQGKADVHIHTRYSDGRSTVRQVLERASADPYLDVIAITDHNTIEGALEAATLAPAYPVEVVVGEEITSLQGHILGLFLKERVPPGLSGRDTVARIHAQGGVAIAAHPFVPRRDYLRGIGRVPMGVGKALTEIPFDGVEVANSFPPFALANRRARQIQRTRNLAALGGSDAHVLEAVGKGRTGFPGRTSADLASAIREGRTSAHASFYGPRLILTYAGFVLDAYRGRRGGPRSRRSG
jgi:predicted metal-dependent phosphoesterase TrpH